MTLAPAANPTPEANPLDAIGIQYNAKLQRLVRRIKKDVDGHLMPLIRRLAREYVQDSGGLVPSSPRVATTDAWSDQILALMRFLFDRWRSEPVNAGARRIAEEFVQSALKRSERDMKRSAGIDIFSGSEKMRDYLKASVQQNVQLIQSIPQKYLEEVETLVMANMRAGMRPSYIERALSQQFGVTSRRAKLIARDQTSKIQGEIGRRQQQDAGFKYFRWVTSHDQRVRHHHAVLGSKITKYGKGIYSWQDLPMGEKGEPTFPGQPINCRCVAVPVSERQVQRNKEQGNVNPSVTR